MAHRIHPGLSCDHESDPDSDLATFGRIFSIDRSTRMALLDHAAKSAQLRHDRIEARPLSRRADQFLLAVRISMECAGLARLRDPDVRGGDPHRPALHLRLKS